MSDEKKPVEVVEEKEKEERPQLSEEEKRRIYMEWATGKKSIRQLSKELGIPRSTLHLWFKKIRQSGMNIDELVEIAAKRVPEEIRERYKEKLRSFLLMTEEQREAVIRRSIMFFVEKARRNPINALNLFAKWLSKPEGMIAYSYLWKPEYVEDVTTATAELLQMMARIMK